MAALVGFVLGLCVDIIVGNGDGCFVGFILEFCVGTIVGNDVGGFVGELVCPLVEL